MINIFHEASPNQKFDVNLMKGYTEKEIQKMERLYDIHIKSELYDFLSCMRRCSSGLMGDYSLMFYRENRTDRSHFFAQAGNHFSVSPFSSSLLQSAYLRKCA